MNLGRFSLKTAREMIYGRMTLIKNRAEEMGLKTSVPISGTQEDLFDLEKFLAVNEALHTALNKWGMEKLKAACLIEGDVKGDVVRTRAEVLGSSVDFEEPLEGYPSEGLLTQLRMICPES